MHILSGYKYLFYRIYRWQLREFGERNNPKLVAIFTNSLFVFFNILTILMIFQIANGHLIRLEKEYWIATGFLIVAVNYFTFFQGGRFDRIISEFADETEEERKRGTIWCWTYIVATHVVFFGIALFLPKN